MNNKYLVLKKRDIAGYYCINTNNITSITIDEESINITCLIGNQLFYYHGKYFEVVDVEDLTKFQ